MDVLKQLNSLPIYLICGGIILFVMGFSVFFLIRAYRAGLAMGMEKDKLKKVIISSASFTVLPSISILLGVIALSGSLGIPLPWLRLSVVGALHYEASVADIAARSLGLSGLNAAEMTTTAFTTIALLMTVGIIWGCLLMILVGKPYSKKLQGAPEKKKSDSPSFADTAMTAMFIGLICTYMGSYIGECFQLTGGKPVFTGEYLQLVTMAVAALAMAGFTKLAQREGRAWLENFAVAGSMLCGMAAAVVCGLVF